MNFLSRNLNFLNLRRWYLVNSCELFQNFIYIYYRAILELYIAGLISKFSKQYKKL